MPASRDHHDSQPASRAAAKKPSRADRLPKAPGPIAFVVAVARNWWADDCLHWGAALAFHALLSLAPLLFTLVFIIGLFVDRPSARASLESVTARNLGPEAAAAVANVTQSMSDEPASVWTATLAILLAIFSASALFSQVQRTVNHIWEVEVAPSAGLLHTIIRRVLAIAMIVLFGALLLLSLAIAWLGAALGRFADALLPSTEWLVAGLDFVGSLLVLTAAIALLFRWLPDVRIRWQVALVGGAATALLFLLGKFAVSYYIRFANVGSAYGAAGSIVVFVVWVYYTAQAFFFGAEFTEVWATSRGLTIVPDQHARWERKCDDDDAGGPSRTEDSSRTSATRPTGTG